MFAKKNRQFVLVLGSPRSGTTWLAEIIDNTKQYKYIFEPFSVRESPDWSDYGWSPVIGKGEATEGSKQTKALKKILQGKVSRNNTWALGRGVNVTWPDRVMVKSVRAQFMLPAIVHLLPEIKIIHIIRDPVATIKSQYKSGFPYPMKITAPKKYALVGEEKVEAFLDKNGTEEPSYRALRWGMENSYSIKFLANRDNCLNLVYEDLRDKPQKHIKDIAKLLDIGPKDTEKLIKLSTKESSTTKLSKKTDIDAKLLQKIEIISTSAVEIFGLSEFYGKK